MKKIQIITITLLAYIALATACNKIKTTTPTGSCGQLPCPTTTGANVASCMINGEPFIVKGKGKYTGMFNCVGGNTLTYGTLAGGYNLEFYNCPDGTLKANSIYFTIFDEIKIGQYNIGAPLINGCVLDMGNIIVAASDSLTSGKIEITHIENHVISGKFNFVIKDPTNGKTYICTEGNFDLSK
jgi:hypothetical protein